MAEHQVMSWWPTHHSHKRDFVSHPSGGVDPAALANPGLIKHLEKQAPASGVPQVVIHRDGQNECCYGQDHGRTFLDCPSFGRSVRDQ